MQILALLFLMDGRINRRQFWLGLFCISAVTAAMGFATRQVYLRGTEGSRVASIIMMGLLAFFVLWTIISISTKRWHDMNCSGAMSLLWLIPIIGPLIVIAWLGCGPTKISREKTRMVH